MSHRRYFFRRRQRKTNRKTQQFLSQYGNQLDDAILSVHFLLHNGVYECMDYSYQVFEKLITRYGSIDAGHSDYYQTVLESVVADLGPYKPTRIGHMTLARKFQRRFPFTNSHSIEIDRILNEIKKRGYELDYNGAGFVKADCLEVYPAADLAKKAQFLGIPLIYGSDAHQAKDLNQGRKQLISAI